MSAKKRVWLEINRASGIEVRPVIPGPTVGKAEGQCPGCGVTPFLIKGTGIHKHDERTMRAGSHCVACDDPVGYVYARVDTIFGLEEDRRVLAGRCRVY